MTSFQSNRYRLVRADGAVLAIGGQFERGPLSPRDVAEFSTEYDALVRADREIYFERIEAREEGNDPRPIAVECAP